MYGAAIFFEPYPTLPYWFFTLLRRKPRSFRPWMDAERVPFEALKERSRVCFGGFRPLKHVEEPRALGRGSTTTLLIVILPTVFFNSGGHLPARSWLGSLFFLVKRLEINEENGRSFFS
jgi:hypothetical protein